MTQLILNPLEYGLPSQPGHYCGKPSFTLNELDQVDTLSDSLTLYSVQIKVEAAHEDRICGEDRVDLSGGAYHIVTARDYPQVAGLRLPPRLPSPFQIASLRGQVMRDRTL